MKKAIPFLLAVVLCMNAFGQQQRANKFPVVTDNFFAKIPFNTLSEVLQKDMQNLLGAVEFNDKMKEQWGIRSAEELKSLTFSVIIPVLYYHSENGNRTALENPDMFYVPLYLNGEIKVVANVSRQDGVYRMTNFGWPVLANQFNTLKDELKTLSQPVYIEMPEKSTGVLASQPGKFFNQQSLQVALVVERGDVVSSRRTPSVTFNEFVDDIYSQKSN